MEEYDPKRKKAKVIAEDEAVQAVPHREKEAGQDKVLVIHISLFSIIYVP